MTSIAGAVPGRRLVNSSAGAFAPTADPYRNILALLMVFTISRIHQNFSFLSPFRPLLVLVALSGLYALMNPKYLEVPQALKTRSFKMICAMGVMACLSVPLSISIGGSAVFILTEFSKVLLFAILLLFGIRNARDLYKFVWAFTVAAACLAYLAIFVYRMHGTEGDSFVRIQSGYSYDSNDMGFVAVLGLCIALLTYSTAQRRGRILCGFLLLGLGMTIGRTGSRGAFLTLAIVIAGLIFLLPNVSAAKKLGFVVVTLVGIVVAAPPGYWTKIGSIFAPTQDYNWTSPTGRKEVALRGLGYMMRNPLTGIGVDNFAKAEGLLSDRAIEFKEGASDVGVKWSAAHNSFIEVAAEMGIPGLILFCSLVFGSAWHCYHLRRRMPKQWINGDREQRFLYLTSIYLPVTLVGFAAGGSLVSFAYLDPIYILAAFVGGLEVSLNVRLKEDAQRARQAVGPVAMAPHARHRGGLPPEAASSSLPPPSSTAILGI